MLDYQQQSTWSNGFGQQQSPINIETPQAAQQDQPLSLTTDSDYQLTEELDDQTTIKLLGTGQATIFKRSFDFQQVHFHAGAEHLVDGNQKPFEIHLVHQNAIGQLVVVALLVSLGDQDAAFQQIIDRFQQGTSTPVKIEIDQWLPKLAEGYHYLGSLTTPPLTEGVEWLVITNPNVTISQDQLKQFQQLFKPNNRVTQPVNGRLVEKYLL